MTFLAFDVPDNVWGALIALLGGATVWLAADARRHSRAARTEATEANTAVNHNREGSPRIYDMVAHTVNVTDRLARDVDRLTAEIDVARADRAGIRATIGEIKGVCIRRHEGEST